MNEKELRIHLSQSLWSALYRRQWKQIDLARASGMSLAELNRFVLGQRLPRLEKFRRLCEVLELSADELLGINGRDHKSVNGNVL